MRGFALERGFITADADLSPERRICGAKGTGIATYRELIKNIASKSSPDGGALSQIIAKWLSDLQSEVAAEGHEIGSEAFVKALTARIYAITRELESEVGGFDFATVLTNYYKAYMDGDEEKKSACMRWLRGEFSTKTEARNAMGTVIGGIIDDDNWYEYVKLWAVFLRAVGYRGFVVFIDECVNLYKIANRISRENNYEKLLSMFNDTLQGKAEGLALIFGGTPQFLEDTRRGLFSYDALKSRLTDSRYSEMGYQNLASPVIRLRRLSDNELLALTKRLSKLYMQKEGTDTPFLSDREIESFVRTSTARAGADEMITPREIIRDFLTLLNILRDNPTATFDELVRSVTAASRPASTSELELAPVDTPKNGKVSLFDIDI